MLLLLFVFILHTAIILIPFALYLLALFYLLLQFLILLFNKLVDKLVGLLFILIVLLLTVLREIFLHFYYIAKISHFPLRSVGLLYVLITVHIALPMLIILVGYVEELVDRFVFEVAKVKIISVLVACAANSSANRNCGVVLHHHA